jgi:hypothetical protein
MSPLIVLPKGVPGGASVKPQRASSMYHNILQLVVFTIFINGLGRGLGTLLLHMKNSRGELDQGLDCWQATCAVACLIAPLSTCAAAK